jgi:hypothetical protein
LLLVPLTLPALLAFLRLANLVFALLLPALFAFL